MTTALPKYFVNYVKETLGLKDLQVIELEDEGLTHAQKYDVLFDAAQYALEHPESMAAPAAAQATVQETAYEEPVVEEQVVAEPAVEQQAVYEEPVAEQPVTEEQAAANTMSYQDDSMTQGQTARDFHAEHMHTVRLQQAGITEEELAQTVAALMAAMGSELPVTAADTAAAQPAAEASVAAATPAAAASDPMSVGQTARDFYEEHLHTVRLQQAGITEEELAQTVAALMEALQNKAA